MTAVIEARGLAKSFGATRALDGVSFSVEPGRIVGLIGPNGAGKTTALKAILGLTSFTGELRVLGLDPRSQRDQLMRDVCFIADVAVLPRWLRVAQAVDFVEHVHPRFDRSVAESFLARTDIKRGSKVGQLSKGMVTQLHLALILAIDARLLVLSSDTPGGLERMRAQLAAAARGDYDVIIGTQLVAKGHNFPLLTLVGVVDADVGLANGDPRAAERTFQLLRQATGRAGRGTR